MTTRPAVALASTIHDPHAADLPSLVAALPDLAERYAGLVIFATVETPDRVLAPLIAIGANVTKHPTAYGEIGWRRLGAVRQAAELAPAVHLCDCDRLLHWWHNYPAELDATIAQIASTDLLLLGRTARAWATHPANQIETEGLANRIVSQFYGAEVDVCSGSRGLSRRAITYLAEHGREHSVGTDAEWPLLLRRAGEFRCEQILTEGLEFESGDRFPEEIARAGGLAAWNAANDRDTARWIFRTRLASDIAAAAVRVAAR
ncbi:MAG TPA: hypothetical protein VIL85_26315 [Thermomicrobiales bacterium]|jgi:hypothetical protein